MANTKYVPNRNVIPDKRKKKKEEEKKTGYRYDKTGKKITSSNKNSESKKNTSSDKNGEVKKTSPASSASGSTNKNPYQIGNNGPVKVSASGTKKTSRQTAPQEMTLDYLYKKYMPTDQQVMQGVGNVPNKQIGTRAYDEKTWKGATEFYYNQLAQSSDPEKRAEAQYYFDLQKINSGNMYPLIQQGKIVEGLKEKGRKDRWLLPDKFTNQDEIDAADAVYQDYLNNARLYGYENIAGKLEDGSSESVVPGRILERHTAYSREQLEDDLALIDSAALGWFVEEEDYDAARRRVDSYFGENSSRAAAEDPKGWMKNYLDRYDANEAAFNDYVSAYSGVAGTDAALDMDDYMAISDAKEATEPEETRLKEYNDERTALHKDLAANYDYAALSQYAPIGTYSTAAHDSEYSMERSNDASMLNELVNAAGTDAYWDKVEEISGMENNDVAISLSGYIQYMSEDDKKDFNYLLRRQGYDAAFKFITEDIFWNLGRQYVDERNAEIAGEIQNKPALAAMHNVMAVANLPLRALGGVAALPYLFAGEEVNEYAPIFGANRYTDIVRGTTSQELMEQFPDANVLGTNLPNFAYGVAASMADSAYSRALFGGFASVPMGLSAYNSALYRNAEEDGASTAAAVDAFVEGALETLTENISVESWYKIKNSADPWKALLKQAGAEGTEELLNFVGINAYDRAKYGELGDEGLAVKELIARGVDPEMAVKTVAMQKIREGAETTISGFVSGFGSSVGPAIQTSYANRQTGSEVMQAFEQAKETGDLEDMKAFVEFTKGMPNLPKNMQRILARIEAQIAAEEAETAAEETQETSAEQQAQEEAAEQETVAQQETAADESINPAERLNQMQPNKSKETAEEPPLPVFNRNQLRTDTGTGGVATEQNVQQEPGLTPEEIAEQSKVDKPGQREVDKPGQRKDQTDAGTSGFVAQQQTETETEAEQTEAEQENTEVSEQAEELAEEVNENPAENADKVADKITDGKNKKNAKVTKGQLGMLYRYVQSQLQEDAQNTLRERMSFNVAKELRKNGVKGERAKSLATSILRIQDGSFTQEDVAAVQQDSKARSVLAAWTEKVDAELEANVKAAKFGSLLKPKADSSQTKAEKKQDAAEVVSEFDAKVAEVEARSADKMVSDGEESTVDGETVKIVGIEPAKTTGSGDSAMVKVVSDDGTERTVEADSIAYSANDSATYDLIQYSTDYGRNADIMYNAYQSGQDVKAYATAFNAAAQHGSDGRNISSLMGSKAVSTLTESQIRTAYEVGRGMRVQRSKQIQNVRSRKGAAVKTGRVDTGAIENVVLNDHQKASIAAMEALTEVLPINVRFVESVADAKGRYTTENGSWNPETRTITLDIHAGSNYESDVNYAMMDTVGHELTHYIRDFADSELWDEYQDFVISHLDTRMDLESEIKDKMAQNRSMSRDDAIEEIIADASVQALSNITDQQISELAESNPTLFKKIANGIKKWISNLKEKIRKAFKNTGAQTNRFAKEMEDLLDELSAKWNRMLINANRNANKAEAQKKAPEAVRPKKAQKATEAKVQSADKLFIPYAHIDERSLDSVKDEHTELFCKGVPEVRFAYATAAGILMDDLNLSSRGQKHFIWGEQGDLTVTGQKRITSELIADMKDHLGWSWKEIGSTLQSFIDMDSAEKGYPLVKNTIRNRRMEVLLHEMLTRGYTTIEGKKIAPWKLYADVIAEYQGSRGDGLNAKVSEEAITFEEYAFPGLYAEDGGVKYQTRLSKNEVAAIQAIGEKSINEFTSADIKKTEHLARRYFKEMGVKSPFFRAWFGDWRAFDKTLVQIANRPGAERGAFVNEDTGWSVQVSAKVFSETKAHILEQNQHAINYLPYINDIVKKAILLDSASMRRRKSENSLLMHTLYAIADIGNGPELVKLYVEEINSVNSEDTSKRTWQLQALEKRRLSVKGSGQALASAFSIADAKSIADLVKVVKQFGDLKTAKFVHPKLLNRDGTPKLLYHQTNAEFTEFDVGHEGAGYSDSEMPSGIYMKDFPDTIKLGMDYESSHQMGLYAAIRNPLVFSDRSIAKWYWTKNVPGYAKLSKELDELNASYGEEYNKWEELWFDPDDAVSEKAMVESDRILEVWTEAENAKLREMHVVIDNYLAKQDYDGIILEADRGTGGTVKTYVALKNTQVKSATDNIGTFDPNNPDIRYSVRETTDGRKVVAVEDDILQEIYSGGNWTTEQKGKAKKAARAALESAGPIYGGGIPIYINADTRREFPSSNYVRKTLADNNQMLADRYRIASEAKDLLIATPKFERDPKTKPREDFVRFMKGSVYMSILGRNYEAVVKVGVKTNGGYVLYDLVDMKNASFKLKKEGISSTAQAKKAVAMSSELPSNGGTISQNDTDVKNQLRDPYNVSDRELLANTVEGMVTNVEDLNRLKAYQKKIGELNEQQKLLQQTTDRIAMLRKADAAANKDEIARLKNQADIYAKKIDRADAALLKIEAMAPIRELASRQRAAYVKDVRAKANERIREYKKDLDAETKEKIKNIRKKEAEKRKEMREEIDRLKRVAEPDLKEKYRAKILADAKRLYTWITAPTNKKHVPEILKVPLGEFIQSIDYSSARSLAGKGQAIRDIDMAEALENLRRVLANAHNQKEVEEGVQEQTGYIDLPDQYLEQFDYFVGEVKKVLKDTAKTTETPLLKMKVDQLEYLSEMFAVLKHSVGKMNEMFVNNQFETARSASNATIDDMYALKAKVKTNKVLETVNTMYNWKNTTPYYAFQRMGRGGKAIFEGLQDGWDKMAENSAVLIEYAENAFTSKQAKAWSKDIKTIKLDSGESVQMTAAQAMSVYCLNKRAQAQGHLLGGGIRISDINAGRGNTIHQVDNYILSGADVAAIINTLTEEQKGVADKLQEFMNTQCTDWGNEISMKRFGYKMFTEKHYFPIETDANNRTKIDDKQDGGQSMFRLLNMSAMKPLTPKANNAIIIRDIFDVFSNHTSDIAKYNALALPILDFIKWYNHVEKSDVVDAEGNATGQIRTRSTQKALEHAYGQNAKQYLTSFIKDLNAEHDGGRNDTFLSKLMSNAKAASVGWNARVYFLQITSLPRAAYAINPKYLMKGFAKLKSLNPVNAIKGTEAQEKIGILKWKSLGFYNTDTARSTRSMVRRNDGFLAKVRDYGMRPAGWGDNWTSNIIYEAVKAEMKDKHPNLEAGSKAYEVMLNRRVREIVYKTQVVDSTMTRSDFMRSKGLMQAFTAFMSEPTLTVNMLNESIQEAFTNRRAGMTSKENLRSVGGKVMKAAAVFVVSAAFTAIVEALFDAIRDDDEYETFWEKYLQGLRGEKVKDAEGFLGKAGALLDGNIGDNVNIVGMFPIIKEVVSFMQGYEENSMVTQVAKQFVDLKDSIAAWQEGKRPLYDVIYKGFKTIGSATGVGVQNVSRDGVGLYNTFLADAIGKPKVQTYENSKTDAAAAYYAAITEGDTDKAAWVIERAAIHGFDADDFAEKIKNLVKADYMGGEIDADAATEYLVSYAGKTKDDAYWMLKEWDNPDEENFSKYGDLREALSSGNRSDATAAYNELVKHGVKEKSVNSEISEMYNDGRATNILNLQLRSNNLYSSTVKLKTDGQKHPDDFDAFITAIVNGNGIESEIAKLREKGYTVKQCMSAINGAFGNTSDRYRIMEKYNSREAGILLDRILDAYEALGLDRQEEIDWIEENWKLD